MTRIVALLGCLFVVSCAPARGGSHAAIGAVDTRGAPLVTSDVYIPSGQHGTRLGAPAIMLVVDSVATMIDTTTRSQVYRDSLLATLTGRVITRVRIYPPKARAP